MASLATTDDYEARYGPTSEGTLAQKLASASNAARSYTTQDFVAASKTQVLRLVGDGVRLTQRPVTAIDAVKLVLGNGLRVAIVGWIWDGLDGLIVPRQAYVLNLPEVAYDPYYVRSIEVEWHYGYETVPDEIIDVVCAAARRAMTNPDQLSTELTGSYQNAISSDAADAGPIGFTSSERDILNRYRPRRASTVQL